MGKKISTPFLLLPRVGRMAKIQKSGFGGQGGRGCPRDPPRDPGTQYGPLGATPVLYRPILKSGFSWRGLPLGGSLRHPRPSWPPSPGFWIFTILPTRGSSRNGIDIFLPKCPPAAHGCSNGPVGPKAAPKTASNGIILSVGFKFSLKMSKSADLR